MLLSCYQELEEDLNISAVDRNDLEHKISCRNNSQSADDYYDCMNMPKDSIDFCYDLYMIEQSHTVDITQFNKIDDHYKTISKKVNDCVESN